MICFEISQYRNVLQILELNELPDHYLLTLQLRRLLLDGATIKITTDLDDIPPVLETLILDLIGLGPVYLVLTIASSYLPPHERKVLEPVNTWAWGMAEWFIAGLALVLVVGMIASSYPNEIAATIVKGYWLLNQVFWAIVGPFYS